MSENQTISEKELLDAIKNLLKKSGHLNKFQAEVLYSFTNQYLCEANELIIFRPFLSSEFFALISRPFTNILKLHYMRAKVIQVLQERQDSLNPGFKNSGAPQPTDEVLLINELIKEYLEWNGYLYTASVLTSEATLPDTKKSRAEMCAEVGVKDDEKSSALPLLSNIVAAYTERIRRKISRIKKESQ